MARAVHRHEHALGAHKRTDPGRPTSLDGPMLSIEIPINGMTCGGCVNSVRNALTTIAGVQQAQVQVGTATVTYDPSRTDPDALRGAIARAGFTLPT